MKPIYRHRAAYQFMQLFRFPLTLVSAPPGFGKTDSLRRFLRRRRGVDSVWAETPTELLRLLETRQDCSRPTVIVFDDADRRLPGAEMDLLRNGIEAFLSSTPSDLHLLLLARKRPCWLDNAVVYGSGTLLLGSEALRFTREEAQSAFEENGIPPSYAASIWEATEGWPVMVSLCVDAGGILTPKCTDFVKEKILASMDEASRELFCRLSLVERFCPEEAVTVTGERKAALILRDYAGESCLLREEGKFYRMHPILRAAAREELPLTGKEVTALEQKFLLWEGGALPLPRARRRAASSAQNRIAY